MKHARRSFVTLVLAVLGALVFLGGAAVIFYAALPPADRETVSSVVARQGVVLAMLGLLLVLSLGMLVELLLRRYVIAARALVDETDLILGPNPGRRVHPAGTPELRALARAVNRFAERHQELQNAVTTRIEGARADMEEEKNRLAALMSELTQGVVVCNTEGRILLYNSRAKHLLSEAPFSTTGGNGPEEATSSKADGPARSSPAGGLIGLGRSIFSVIDRDLILHGLQNLQHLLQAQEATLISQFVTTAPGNHLIRIQMAPVLDREQAITGYVLTLEDMTRAIEFGGRRDALLQSLMETTRSSLGSIRAAIENILEFPEMAAERRARFSTIIRDEAVTLSRRLDAGAVEFSEHVRTQWPLEDMRARDLIALIRRRIESAQAMGTRADDVDDSLWLKIDSYSVARALSYLASRLREECGVTEVGLRLERGERLAQLDMTWSGMNPRVETMQRWESEPVNLGGGTNPYSLREVAERHGGDVWHQMDASSGTAYVRVLLPVTEPVSGWDVRVVRESRPEYYDFDLFHQPGQTPQLDEVPLAQLSYTVFDTETTGLHPSEGDEIISIGAIRIVNGRLLQSEAFDQLVNPHRLISPTSIAITGITPDMLVGQPSIDIVLPQFHRFAEETVLVAHNAAFDMRFLQMKEEQTGVRFINPVLDTLLLSAVIHPNQEVHRLEMIAERLGVSLIGRHTALGDAILTGEAFLKMLPLLADKGIHTLRQAREAAEQTYYSRIAY